MNNSENSRIAITGVGPLSSIGIGKDVFWKGILGKNPTVIKEDVNIDGELWDSYHLHKIQDFNVHNYGIKECLLEEIFSWKGDEAPIDLQYLMVASKLALDDSRLPIEDGDNDIGMVLAHENPGTDQFLEKAFSFSYDRLSNDKGFSKRDFFNEAYSKCRKDVYDLQTFMFLFHVGKVLGIHGNALFLNNACASGLYAIEMASLMIKSGHCRAVIVVAADHPDIFKYLWFKGLGAYADDGIIKPFSKEANGLVFGSGGAAIVLENLSHAKDRGADIYAEYLGGAFSFEGWKVSLPATSENYYRDTILSALKRSEINSGKVELVVPHGVGMSVVDRYEASALAQVFSNDKKPFYSAFKPFIGHNLGGSTLLESVMLLLAMKKNIIPPTLNCGIRNKGIEIDLVDDFTSSQISIAMKTVAAFAGFNGAAVFKGFQDEL